MMEKDEKPDVGSWRWLATQPEGPFIIMMIVGATVLLGFFVALVTVLAPA
jgi:hypothetical protein